MRAFFIGAAMTGTIATIPKYQFLDSLGVPLVNGTLTTYLTGTTTLTSTWQDQAQASLNTNPIVLDARGEATLWLDPAIVYKFVLKNEAGATLWTQENISGVNSSEVILRADLASSSGSGLVGFIQDGSGAIARTAQDALRDLHNCLNFYNPLETTAEGMINRAISAHNKVHIPAGIYSIDTDVGVIVKTGTVITGDGRNKTILSAVAGKGGSLADLAAYSKGSIIKRLFNPISTNLYVNDGYIADIGLVLNHVEDAITATQIQIGFDMRNITSFTIERCHTGNIPPVGGSISPKMGDKSFLTQGYPVVFGNISGSDPAYAGGEKNRFLNCSVFGGYKCVIQDETTLSPNSASYGTVVRDCDIQSGHWLIGQMGQYGAGNVHYDNILQDIQKRAGDVSPSYVQYYDGYNNLVRPAYIEAGTNVDFQLLLDTDANNNIVDMSMAGMTGGAGLIQDNSNANSYNRITSFGVTGSTGIVELYNKARKSAWVKFHWSGSVIVIDGSEGVLSVTRTGVGDYTITWLVQFPSANYNLNYVSDTNASGHGGMVSVLSHSTTNLRITTSAQNGATTTIIDPRFVWVGAGQ